jgi:hypothetical protein
MRTYDKLIATIRTRQAQEDLRLRPGTSLVAARTSNRAALLQEAG